MPRFIVGKIKQVEKDELYSIILHITSIITPKYLPQS